MKKKTKKIIVAEAIFVVGVFVYLFFSTSPSQIYPLSGMTIIESDFVFEIENGEEVLISFDEDFTEPIVLNASSDIIFPPGTYYWKVRKGFRESEVKNFTIQGHVSLNIQERKENYELYNSGNVELNVTKKKARITKIIILDPGESEEIEKDNSTYEGRQL
ncbi:hypothetical protein KAT80_02460 [Candidatus Pacearchaeota archaeon]|nr:hypothetical protein [Candidatus Pacearchaeota archaeon]